MDLYAVGGVSSWGRPERRINAVVAEARSKRAAPPAMRIFLFF